MEKSVEVIRLEEEICQKLELYLSSGLNDETEHLLKKGKKVFIHIIGYIVILKQVSPVKIDFVIPEEDVKLAEEVLRKLNEDSALFSALSNNMMQRIF